jgi:prepilin-type N-terminal cleavage/methylation domain-containing protein
MKKILRQSGMSLLEILVVVSIFAILGIITTRSVLLTLQGSKKSESIVRVRENLDYSMGIIERQIRNANSLTACPNPDPSSISYVDQTGATSTFSCVGTGTPNSYIASGSAILTSNEIEIVGCQFTCSPSTDANPPVVFISLEAKDVSATGVQNTSVSTSTQIYLRNY